TTAMLPAEEMGPGSAVTLVPRRPGDSWHGSVGGDGVPTGLQSTKEVVAPRAARYDSFGSGRFRLVGPLVRDRLRLLIAGSIVRAKRLERSDATPLEGREAGLLAHVVWTPREQDEVRFLGAAQGVRHPYAGRARYGDVDVHQDDRFFQLQSTWQRRG